MLKEARRLIPPLHLLPDQCPRTRNSFERRPCPSNADRSCLKSLTGCDKSQPTIRMAKRTQHYTYEWHATDHIQHAPWRLCYHFKDDFGRHVLIWFLRCCLDRGSRGRLEEHGALSSAVASWAPSSYRLECHDVAVGIGGAVVASRNDLDVIERTVLAWESLDTSAMYVVLM